MSLSPGQLKAAVKNPATLRSIVKPIVNTAAQTRPSDAVHVDAADNVLLSRSQNVYNGEVGEDPRSDTPSSGNPSIGGSGVTDPRDDTPSSGNPILDALNPGSDQAPQSLSGIGSPGAASNISLANSCEARPQGAVGSPADPYSYQNGSGQGNEEGYDPTAAGGGGPLEQGKMSDEDWANMKHYSKTDVSGLAAHGDPNFMNKGEMMAADRLSDCYGSKVPFTSAHRPPAYNAKVGGAKNSQHMHGNALDFDMSGMGTGQRSKLLNCAFDSGFSGFGFYKGSPNMLHLDQGNGRTWGPQPAWANPIMQKRYKPGMKPSGAGSPGTAEGAPYDVTNTDTGNIGAEPINPPPESIAGNDRSTNIEILSRTLFGESSGESYRGKIAVASVIRTRLAKGKWGNSWANVCLKRLQFSCWNTGKGGLRSKLCGLTTGNATFRLCVQIATKFVDGQGDADPTGGADHFHTTSMSTPSGWNVKHTVTIEHHKFFIGQG